MTKDFMVLAYVIGASVASGAMLDLQPQIDAAAAKGGGVVRVEPGEHETKPFELKSNVTLELANGATILASTNIADYATRATMRRTSPLSARARSTVVAAVSGRRPSCAARTSRRRCRS